MAGRKKTVPLLKKKKWKNKNRHQRSPTSVLYLFYPFACVTTILSRTTYTFSQKTKFLFTFRSGISGRLSLKGLPLVLGATDTQLLLVNTLCTKGIRTCIIRGMVNGVVSVWSTRVARLLAPILRSEREIWLGQEQRLLQTVGWLLQNTQPSSTCFESCVVCHASLLTTCTPMVLTCTFTHAGPAVGVFTT